MRYSILTVVIEIDTSSPEIRRHLDHLYGEFCSDPSDAPIARYLVTSGNEIQAESKTYSIYRNGHGVGHYADKQEFLFRFEQMVMRDVMEQLPHLFLFHAAALANEHGAFIFPGPSGAGKSTLAMALAERNFHYLSDELAPIEKRTHKVYPFPRSIKLRPKSFDLFSISKKIPEKERTQSKYFNIYKHTAEKSDAVYKVKCILFPSYDPTEKPSLIPVSKAVAVCMLAQCCSDLCTYQKDFLLSLSELVNNISCYEIITNNIEESYSIIEKLM